MTGKDLTKISRDYIEAFNAANWSRVKETLAGNSLYNEVGTQRRIQGADAMVILTEWDQFRALDLNRVKAALRKPVVIDLRSIYKPADMAEKGFSYVSVGRG